MGDTLPCDLSHDAFEVTYPQPHGQTDAYENITFCQLHLWVVIILGNECFTRRLIWEQDLEERESVGM